ncbi:MAG TPA: alpha/beta hydrolase [Egibacteraceae bacterium]|nr:alpha/beta hydrolase [Egibacteraceae bacterium]
MDGEELWVASDATSLRLVAYDGPGAGGPSVVALHGLVTAVDVLRGAVVGFDPYRRLAAEGLNVLALDWPGHGRSGGRRGHLTYRGAMAAAAAATACARQRWGGPVGLFGTALGGVLAFYAALEGSGVGAVACHNVLDLRDIRPILQRTRQGVLLPAAGLLRRRLSPRRQEAITIPASTVVATADLAEDPRLARTLSRHPLSVRRYTLAGLGSILLTPEDKPDVSAQAVPTFVAVGSNDRVLPETTTRAFASRLTVDSELWVLPGGGHQMALEHPDALLPVAAGFLKRHLAGGR